MNNRFHVDALNEYDAFTGEPERVPGDRYVFDPGRSIAITPELLAEEAAKQAQREAERTQITWRRPEPVSKPAYRSTPNASHSHHPAKLKRSTPKPERNKPMPHLPPAVPAVPQPIAGTFRIVPKSTVPARGARNSELIDGILSKLREIPADQAIQLTCESAKQATNRRVHIVAAAKKAGLKVEGRVHGKFVSVWLTRTETK